MRLLKWLIIGLCLFGAYTYYAGKAEPQYASDIRQVIASGGSASKVMKRYPPADRLAGVNGNELWVYRDKLQITQVLVVKGRPVRVCTTSRITEKIGFGSTSCQREALGEAGL